PYVQSHTPYPPFCRTRLLCLLFSPFFFDVHVLLSASHSFPTRRSSDLQPMALRGGTPRGISTRLIARPSGMLCTAMAVVIKSPRDRKSTRLNSSHVSNSYAVFCLKKKNTFTNC